MRGVSVVLDGSSGTLMLVETCVPLILAPTTQPAAADVPGHTVYVVFFVTE